MVMLLCRVGGERYAIDTASVVEVIPHIYLFKYPDAAPAVLGRINYHRQLLPVFDLAQLLGAAPSQAALSTRIVVIEAVSPSGQKDRLGLLVEQLTETIAVEQMGRIEEHSLSSSNSIFGDVFLLHQETIQSLQVGQLLNPTTLDGAGNKKPLPQHHPGEETTVG